MKTLRPAAALLLLGMTAASYQQNPSAPKTAGRPGVAAENAAMRGEAMTADQVAAKIHAIDMMEIQAGQLALSKSKDSETIRFAKLLVRDHRLTDKKLQSFAKRQKMALGTAKTEPGEAAMMRKLETAAKGPEFDRVFADAMKQGHDEALAFLRGAKSGTTEFRLRAFIGRVLPVIEQHDALAGKLQGRRLG